MKKSNIFVRLLAILMVVMLVIPDVTSFSAATKAAVESVEVTNLPANTLTLKKGKSFTLKTKVKTTGSISKSLVFKTSDSKVATVSTKGKITAKKKGTAKITVVSKANTKKKATITVTVGTPVTKVALSSTKATVGVGSKTKLSATVTKSSASNKKVVWTSSNSKVATVDSKGNVTGVKAGTATITATAADGSGKKATCKVTVKKAVTGITLNKTELELFIGKTSTLKATVSPKDATSSVTWKSSNTKVATVTSKGKVKAVKTGTATITATATDGSGKKVTCKVTVKKPVEKITLNTTSKTAKVGDVFSLTAKVTPNKATDKSVIWSSSNEDVAIVTANGKVSVIGAGTATITATAADGSGKKATCTVTVQKDIEIASAVVTDKETIVITLSDAYDLNANQVAVKTKVNAAGQYRTTVKVASVTASADKLTYTIKLDKKNRLTDEQALKVIITGINGTETAEIETLYTTGVKNYAYNYTYNVAVGEDVNETYTISVPETFKLENLPAGLNWKTAKNNDSRIIIYGTPTTVGSSTSVLYYEDEYCNTYTYNLNWNIYTQAALAGSSTAQYYVLKYVNGMTPYVDVDFSIQVSGGSGSYTYAFENNAGQGLTINAYGDITGRLTEVKDYSMNVIVTDKNNTALTTKVPVEIHVTNPSVKVTGQVTDATGNPLSGVSIVFENKDVNSLYANDCETSTSITYVSNVRVAQYTANVIPGTYDVYAEYNGTKEYLYSQTFTAETRDVNFVLPLYMVTISSDTTSISAGYFNSWYNEAEEYYGSGSILYLEAGTYHLETSGSIYSYDDYYYSTIDRKYTAAVDVTVADKPVEVTAKVATEYRVNIQSNNDFVSSSEFDKWYDANGVLVGSGTTLYLAPGTYAFQTTGTVGEFSTYTAVVNVTVTNASQTVTANVTVTASAPSSTDISVDVPVSCTTTESGTYYKFTAPATGTYYFYSTNYSSCDPYARLYNAVGELLRSNDDDGSGYNFYISQECVAGQTYYLKVTDLHNNNGGTMMVNVSMTYPYGYDYED